MMSETQVIDDDEKFVGTPAEDAKDVMRQAREMIPVGLSGAAPTTFADQVTFARDMAKARYSIPAHLQNNVGDCLAIVDMASRAGLSPYMVAQKTYVQSGRINFESQLYHAFLQASGLLKGDLFVEYENAGDDLVCVITGYLKGDSAPRVHRSEPFSKMHPGHVEKDGKKFVRGSPLWDRKPKLQLFYDTSRDWVRMYAPRATLGILTPYEQEEYGPENARDVTPVGLSTRLKGLANPQTTGHRDGHADEQLDVIENGTDPAKTGPDLSADVPTDAETAPATTDRPKTAKRTTDRPRAKTATQQPDTKTAKPGSGRPAKPGKTETKTAPATGSASGSGAANATAVTYPANVPDYLRYARAWIKAATDMTSMGMRWRDEKNLRNKIGMTAEDRKPLEDLLAKRYGEK